MDLPEIRPSVQEATQLAGPDPPPANENEGFVSVGHLIKRGQPGVKVVFVTFVEKSEQMAACDDPGFLPFALSGECRSRHPGGGLGSQLFVAQLTDDGLGRGVEQQVDHCVSPGSMIIPPRQGDGRRWRRIRPA